MFETIVRHGVTDWSVLTLEAVDDDAGLNAQVEYHLLTEGHFKVNLTSGQLTVARPLDFEVD